MKIKLLLIFTVAAIISSCVKARECHCYNSKTQKTDIIYINGNQSDSKKACVNLADSNEVCTLK